MTAADARVKEANARKSESLDLYRRRQAELRQKVGELEAAEQRIRHAEADLSAVKGNQKKHRQNIRLAERELAKLERELAERRPAADDEETKQAIQERLNAVKAEMREALDRLVLGSSLDAKSLSVDHAALTKDCESLEKT
jgi:predicted  nucleic acid-binding Zn-ribbon protein